MKTTGGELVKETMLGDPEIRFYNASRKQDMGLCKSSPLAGWIVYKHPDGQWVTYREATEADLRQIETLTNWCKHPKCPNMIPDSMSFCAFHVGSNPTDGRTTGSMAL